ncbi:hypothetical protein DL98DRAFT_295898 [Cadophora sp. DSE1049]|nr:hypothetical protein DL98DRAFT_295898 [Cadophora sp. DSE1049]
MNLQPEDEQKWGSLFAMHKQTFGAHIQYITHQRRATIAARREFGKISQIDHEITADINTLEMYFVRPFPRLRLLQFPLLLKDLRDRPDVDEKTRTDLTIGMLAVERVIEKSDATINREWRTEALDFLFSRMND